jgi:phosphoribosyl 1,2-cyclic phosphodiesterase
MRFASLGSGSRGNALVVEAGRTRVLVDCGFGPRELLRRLGRLGVALEDIDAVLVTHEHSDHVGGAAALLRRHGCPIYMTQGTHLGSGLPADRVTLFDGHSAFAIGELEILPYPVPHDAREPSQFVFADGRHRLGLLTDAGSVTPSMTEALAGCSALILECNHDPAMLAAGRYPWPLKQRIAGPLGHLDNDSAGQLLRQLAGPRLRHVVAAHLSAENNTPGLARASLAAALGCTADWIAVADQTSGLDWRSLD